jgi:hypothetical protein
LKVRFIYQGSDWLPDQEKVAINLCLRASKIIDLPDEIEVEFVKMPPSVYGETLLYGRFKNRFRINDCLSPKEIIKPVVHELIHIHQVHIGRLKAMRDGTYIWDGRQYKNTDPNLLENSAYRNLPWEQDVENVMDSILNRILTQT